MLSRAQFEKIARNAQPSSGGDDGGDTVDVDTERRPRSGYAVSLSGAEHQVPRDAYLTDAIEGYAGSHHSTLSQPGVYLGVWSPASETRTVLDHTRLMKSRARALREMVMENQEAVYHLDSGQTVPNVLHQTGPWDQLNDDERGALHRDIANLWREHYGRPPLEADEAERQQAPQ